MGFRQNVTTGVAVDDEPETIYMVTSGTHYNGHCCFVRLSSPPLPTATTTSAVTMAVELINQLIN